MAESELEELRRQVQELREELEVASSLARESGCAQREQVMSALVARAISLLRYVVVQLDGALSSDYRRAYEALRELKTSVSRQLDRIERDYARAQGHVRPPPEEY